MPRKNPLQRLYHACVTDMQAFWRFGIKGTLRKLQSRIRYRAMLARQWRQTRSSRRKLAQHESAISRHERKAAVARAINQVLGVARSILTFPWWAVVQLITLFRHLRRLSARRAIEEIWFAYVSLLERVAQVLASPVKRLASWPKWVRVSLGIMIGILVVGAAASPFALIEFKKQRAHTSLAEAQELRDSGKLREAFRKSRTAALLLKNDPEVVRQVIELANDAGSPEVVWWSQRLADLEGESPEFLAEAAAQALSFSQDAKAAQYWAKLRSKYPDHEATREAGFKVMLAKRQQNAAIQMAEQIINLGDDNPLAYAVFIEFLARSPLEADRQRAHELLDTHLYQPNLIGLSLARLVLRGDLSDAITIDYARLIESIDANPEASGLDRALTLGRAYQAGFLNPAEAASGIVDAFQSDESYSSTALARNLLFNLGLFDETAALISSEELESSEDAVFLFLQTQLLAPEPRIDVVEAILDGTYADKTATLPPTYHSLMRAFVAQQRGLREEASHHLKQAVDGSSREQWGVIAGLLARLAEPQDMLGFYRELYSRSGSNPTIAGRYLRLAYQLNQQEEISTLVRQLRFELFHDDPPNQVFLIYLKSLFQESLPACRFQAEELLNQFPDDLGVRACLAFAYWQSRQAGLARTLTQPINTTEELPDYLRLGVMIITNKPEFSPNPDSLPLNQELELFESATASLQRAELVQ